MRRNTFFIIVATLIFALFNYSCDDSVEGAIFDVEDGVHAAFASTLQLVEMLPSDGNQIKVPVYRGGKSTAEVTVPVSLTLASSVPAGTFALSSPNVQFKAGENVAYAVVTYEDINKLSVSAIYELTLEITDENMLSVSKASKIVIKANRKLTFKDFGTGIYTSKFFGEAWEVVVQKAEEADMYKILDCYYNDFPILFAVGSDNKISIPTQPMGYVHDTHGMVSMAMPAATYASQPYREGKTFYLWSRFVVPAGSFGTFEEKLVLN